MDFAETIFGADVLRASKLENAMHHSNLYRVTVRQQGRRVEYVVEHWVHGKAGSPTADEGEFRVNVILHSQQDAVDFLKSLPEGAKVEYTTKVLE